MLWPRRPCATAWMSGGKLPDSGKHAVLPSPATMIVFAPESTMPQATGLADHQTPVVFTRQHQSGPTQDIGGAQALGLGLQTPISLRYWMVSPIAVRTGWEHVGLANRWLQIDRSGPFLPSFCPTARLSGYKSGKNWGRWGRFSL